VVEFLTRVRTGTPCGFLTNEQIRTFITVNLHDFNWWWIE
jgi:hypothetical protein